MRKKRSGKSSLLPDLTKNYGLSEETVIFGIVVFLSEIFEITI